MEACRRAVWRLGGSGYGVQCGQRSLSRGGGVGALSPPTRLRLVERHGAFLDMVHTQGDDIDGTVTLKHFDSNCVTEITVSNPASRGSITGRMMLELAEIVDQLCPGSGGHHGSTPPAPAPASNDIDSGGGGGSVVPTPTRGLILRGTDQFFSSGANFPLCTTRLQTNAAGVLMGAFMTDALTRIRTAPFISVAVLNGPALGGGAELATAPDFRIVRGSGHPEPYAMFVHAKVGASPGWGGLSRLCSIVGRRDALRLLCTAARCDVDEMLRIGLADGVYDPEEATATEAGLLFLEPFLDAKLYGGSVTAIKSAVSAACDDGLHSTNPGPVAEAAAFQSRWAGPDNQTALGKAVK